MKLLTEPQYLALKKYEDEQARNEKAMGVHGRVYESLSKLGYVKRAYFLQSRITPEGRAALVYYEDHMSKGARHGGLR